MNGPHSILEMEGIKPKKLFTAPSPGDFDYTRKQSYAEVYQPDILPKLAEANKKSKTKQRKGENKKKASQYNELHLYQEAFKALEDVKITYNEKEYHAITLLKDKCVYKLIEKIKTDMNYSMEHALVVRWAEHHLLSVIGEYDSILELEPLLVEVSTTEDIKE